MRTISFHRQYLGYTGGHQKVFDYIKHTSAHDDFSPRLYLSDKNALETAKPDTAKPETSTQENNPFKRIEQGYIENVYQPNRHNIAFLAGLDWRAYQRYFDSQQIKVNLIQHLRHADKEHVLNSFLSHKAIRLCVSQAVCDAVSKQANGPCFTIKMGHSMPTITETKQHDLFILATKRPGWGSALADYAKGLGLSVDLIQHSTARELILKKMAAAKMSLVIPNKTEGFYLPGIEAIHYSDVAIVPNCIANLEYMNKDDNAILCANTLNACKQGIDAAIKYLQQPRLNTSNINALDVINTYSLEKERLQYHKILNEIDYIWSQ